MCMHGPVIYGSPSGSVGALLLMFRTWSPTETELKKSLRWGGHGWNHGNRRVVKGGFGVR